MIRASRVNLPIGIELEIDPKIYSLKTGYGNSLLLYTDGIPEQDNPEGEEFGEQRLMDIVTKSLKSGTVLSELLPGKIKTFCGTNPQHDDMTFLLFQF